MTEWLNYHGKIEYQKPKALRVVHTRSRALYAAVMNPSSNTALGLPLDKAVLKTRTGIQIIGTTNIPAAGTIIDNMLYSIEVKTADEGFGFQVFSIPRYSEIWF